MQSQQPVRLVDVDTMLIGVSYMMGYLGSSIIKTKPLNLTNDTMFWVSLHRLLCYCRRVQQNLLWSVPDAERMLLGSFS
jgi:hypothetical protein